MIPKVTYNYIAKFTDDKGNPIGQPQAKSMRYQRSSVRATKVQNWLDSLTPAYRQARRVELSVQVNEGKPLYEHFTIDDDGLTRFDVLSTSNDPRNPYR
jgi:hypothetical protein